MSFRKANHIQTTAIMKTSVLKIHCILVYKLVKRLLNTFFDNFQIICTHIGERMGKIPLENQFSISNKIWKEQTYLDGQMRGKGPWQKLLDFTSELKDPSVHLRACESGQCPLDLPCGGDQSSWQQLCQPEWAPGLSPAVAWASPSACHIPVSVSVEVRTPILRPQGTTAGAP